MGLEERFPLLARIQDPVDLRALPAESLEAVTHELRAYLVETMARTGGHFAANLGTVELATVLHYVFDTPRDRLVWDVATRPIRTRFSPAAATGWAASASRAGSRPSPPASRASTTPSASATRAPR